jgi:HlyD family secretion protein
MDREKNTQVIKARKRNRFFLYAAIVLILCASLWAFRFMIKSSVNRANINTAVVQIGDVENTLNATGEVLPEFEEVLTSPIHASIKSALRNAGNNIRTGESLITLDKSTSEAEYEKQRFQLESKLNEINKLKLDLSKSFYDIKSNNAIKQLRISSLIDAVENARRLFKAGGGTQENVEQAQLNLQVAKLEKQQLENEIRSKQQTMQIEMKEAEISAAIQRSDMLALQRKLNLANIVATRNGVITYLNKNIGATVNEGETLARIADLSSFKIAGSISDNSLDQMHTGIPVIVRINDTQLRGHVSNVSPAIANGVISFEIQLDERNNKLLRPNMKVDVYVITAAHSKVMRVANGAAFKGSSAQEIFVVKNGKAERRTVHTGLSNFDFVEIKDGVKPGETIITSDMADYLNVNELTIKD